MAVERERSASKGLADPSLVVQCGTSNQSGGGVFGTADDRDVWDVWDRVSIFQSPPPNSLPTSLFYHPRVVSEADKSPKVPDSRKADGDCVKVPLGAFQLKTTVAFLSVTPKLSIFFEAIFS